VRKKEQKKTPEGITLGIGLVKSLIFRLNRRM
jgi:hypothetical protein